MINEITSPPVRYTGGKWNLAPWIISHFPAHTCYVEPFCGGASVLLRKRPSTAEVINDMNRQILNFFDVLRDHTDEFIRAIELTPHSRAEFERSQLPSENQIENARRFYIRSRQSFMSSEASKKPAWRFEINVHKLIDGWNKTSHLWQVAQRLKNVQLECDKA
jgi:DNA adenine methylase